MTQSPSPIVDEVAFEAARFAYEAPENWSRAPSVCLHAAIAAYLSALASPPKAAKAEHVGAEVVAWRYRSGYDGRWELFPNDKLWKEGGYAARHPDAQPLFAAPQPSSVGGEREAALEDCAAIADAVADEQDVLAIGADESNFAGYRQGERVAKQISDLIRALSNARADNA